eukprot:jgi/Mesvir1/19725/Mv09980-RA.1
MQLQGAIIQSVPVPCANLSMSTTFVAQFVLAANSVAQRSDIGIYFSEVAISNTAALIGNSTCTIGTVPYSGNVSYTEVDTIRDYCGDATSSAPYNPIYPTFQVTLPCYLYDMNTELLQYSYCITWKQSGSIPDLCYNPLQTVAGTGAKCVCGTVNVPISISCLFEANPDASCNDNNNCTIDKCNPIDAANNGCTYTDTCDDNIPCTVDKCTAAGCTYTPTDSLCDDGIACTVDTCSATAGCSHTKNNTLCNDGLACSVDTCVADASASNVTSGCSYTFGTVCGDSIACTVDPCMENATASQGQYYYLGDGATVPAGTRSAAWANNMTYYDYTGLCLGLQAMGTNATSMVCKHAPCVNDIYRANTQGGGSIQCTANDMQLQGAIIQSVPVPCANLSMSTTFVAQFVLAANSVAQRSDIGIYFSEVAISNTAALIGNSTCTIGTVPYSGNVSYTEVDTIRDYCGDATSSAPYNPIYPTFQVTLPCYLYDMNTKLLQYSYCITWKQSGSIPDLCYNPLQTVAGTGAKCVCGTVNVPISISCLFEANPDASCNDNNNCTIDKCNPIDAANNGCTYTDTCDDNIPCTVDKCTAAGCTYTPTDSLCDDGIACTVDTCSATAGCSHTKNNTLCNDGLACSVDTCVADASASNVTSGCSYTFGTVCGDSIACTVDPCMENATASQGQYYYLGDGATVPAGTRSAAWANNMTYYDYTGLCLGLQAMGTNATSMVCKHAPCVNDIYRANTQGGGSIQCTANDMQLQGAIIQSVPVPCANLSMSTTFVAQFVLAANSVAQRSDIGIYFSEVAISNTAALIGNSTCTIGTVPYSGNVSYTEVDTIRDYCGDATSSAPYNPIYPTFQVTLPCYLYDMNTKLLQYSYCITWKQSGSIPDLCYNPLQTVAGTGAKCVCGTVNVPISISCLFEANPDASCNDNKNCTIDKCNPIDAANNGCTYTDTCDDNIPCTVDKCTAAGCTYTPTDSLCDDGIACTVDTCSATAGCSHTKNNTLCNDGLACSVDTCVADASASNVTSGCSYTFGTVCGDSIACTVDVCVENATAPSKYSCSYSPNDSLCVDSYSCTVDKCDVTAGGCTNTKSDALCEDGKGCSVDTCVASPSAMNVTGGCNNIFGIVCNDNIACTIDTCVENATAAPKYTCSYVLNMTMCGIIPTEPGCWCPETINITFFMTIPLAGFTQRVEEFMAALAGQALPGLVNSTQIVILSAVSGSTILTLAIIPAEGKRSFDPNDRGTLIAALHMGRVFLPDVFGLDSITLPDTGRPPVCTLPREAGKPPIDGSPPVPKFFPFQPSNVTTDGIVITRVDVSFSRPCQGADVIPFCGDVGCLLKLPGPGSHVNITDYKLQETYTADYVVQVAYVEEPAMANMTKQTFGVRLKIAGGICRDAMGNLSTDGDYSITGLVSTTEEGRLLKNKLLLTLNYTISPKCTHGDVGYRRLAIDLGKDQPVKPKFLRVSPMDSITSDTLVYIMLDLSGNAVMAFDKSAFTITNCVVEKINSSKDYTQHSITLKIDESATATIRLEEGALRDLAGKNCSASEVLSITHVFVGTALTNVTEAVGPVLGLVGATNALATVVSSLGAAGTGGPGLLAGLSHLQVLSMLGDLAMDLPPEVNACVNSISWMNLRFWIPWKRSLCSNHTFDEEPGDSLATSTHANSTRSLMQYVEIVWGFVNSTYGSEAINIARPDYDRGLTQELLTSLAPDCGLDVALAIVLLGVVGMAFVAAMHRAINKLVFWFFPESDMPQLLHFPRLELLAFKFIALPFSQASAFLISSKPRSIVAVIFGIVLLLLGPCALLYVTMRTIFSVIARKSAEFEQEKAPPQPVHPAWMRFLERTWSALFGAPIGGSWRDTVPGSRFVARYGSIFEDFKGLQGSTEQEHRTSDEAGSWRARRSGWSKRMGRHLQTSYKAVELSKSIFLGVVLGIYGPAGSNNKEHKGGAWVQVAAGLSLVAAHLAILAWNKPYISRLSQAAETLSVTCELQLFVILLLLLAGW